MTYIEDYLEHICKNNLDSFNSTDAIYFSIYKQTVRGLGLTDKQYDLILKKIQNYFTVENLPTKIPLRSIDRSKYIKLVDTEEVYHDSVYESYKQKWNWIKVRFPFSKKDIVKIESIRVPNTQYVHRKGSHEHYYKFTAKNLFSILSILQNRNFEIDQSLLDYYKKVEEIKNTNFDVFENCLPNEVQREILTMTDLQQVDRGIRYGYKKYKNDYKTLAEQIAYRTDQDICIDPEKNSFEEIAAAVEELDRFPLLILIDEDLSYIQLKQIHTAFKNIPNEKQSVLFRIDNKDTQNAEVNNYIRDNQLNNWVDNTTKIVYIKKNKLPKVLLEADFTPICAIGKSSNRCNSNVNSFISLYCDCVIYHDKSLSLFRRTTGVYL